MPEPAHEPERFPAADPGDSKPDTALRGIVLPDIVLPGELETRRPAADAVEKLAEPADTDDRLPRQPIQWLGLMVVAAVVGGVTGVVGALFRLALLWAEDFRNQIIGFSSAHLPSSLAWIVPAVACAIGAGIGLWLTKRFAPHTAGSGIPRVEAVLRAHLRPAESLILPIKFVGGSLAIGSGLALGREGPTVQMGGTIGRLVSDRLRRFVPEPWTLIAAGAGTGLAVAFNAPLAAALFVMEELLHRFSTRVFSATLIACIVGTIVSRAILGQTTDFSVAPLQQSSAIVLPEYFLLGLAAGVLGILFNVSLIASMRMFRRAASWPRGSTGALVGAAAGFIAWWSANGGGPTAVGGGEVLAEHAIIYSFAWRTALVYFAVRYLLTMGSYGCGAPGGIFAPLLALGALLGNLFATATGAATHAAFLPAPYAIVAMAACFTAVVRSPLTGVVLLLEMTGSWTLILPMMAASLSAYVVPELLGNPPIYDSLRKLDEAAEAAALERAKRAPDPA